MFCGHFDVSQYNSMLFLTHIRKQYQDQLLPFLTVENIRTMIKDKNLMSQL